MRTPLEIISDLKNVTYWSQPNVKYVETIDLLNELEASLTPIKEPIVEVVEEPIRGRGFSVNIPNRREKNAIQRIGSNKEIRGGNDNKIFFNRNL